MNVKSLISVLAVALSVASCGQKGSMPTDNEYPVTTIGLSSTSVQSTYPAVLKGIQDVEIRPKVSGFITQVCIQEGQKVSAGQLLFVIDNTTYQAAVNQAKAALNSANAQLKTAKLTYENNKKLFENKVIGDFELQSAQNTYLNAKAAVAQAQASLANAQEMLSYCFVKSPATGVVGDLPFKKGALVSASSAQPLTTVSDISSMDVYYSMTEKDLLEMTKQSGNVNEAIKNYPPVKLQLADGTIYNHDGKVIKVSGVIDATTGSISVIARFSNPEHLLKSGGAGNIVVPHAQFNAILIPQSATTEVQNKTFVYLLGQDNKVKYTEITVAPQNDGTNFIVTSGLKAGDKIVLQGLASLTDGMEIKPLTPEQYAKKIEEVEKLGENQKDAKSFSEAMKK